jgi:hypothetical protein
MSASNAPIPTVTPGVLALRRMTLLVAVLVVVQTAIGTVVNLYVTVPHHAGAHPANYFTGSLQSVAWALGHGAVALAIHATLGLALVAIAIWLAVRAVKLRPGWVGFTAVLGALLAIGAGFKRSQLPRLQQQH